MDYIVLILIIILLIIVTIKNNILTIKDDLCNFIIK